MKQLNTLIDKEAQKLLFIFNKSKLSLSTAESCTGGLISTIITSFSGASSVFMGGIIAYDNQVKNKLLGIPFNIIDNNGAVSAAVAEAMSQNTVKMFNTNFAISVTGVAGPNGGSVEKPVGTVWISISYLIGKSIKTKSNLFCFGQKSREHIRKLTCYEAMKLANSIALNNNKN
jgi:PncC family amidohydrolase